MKRIIASLLKDGPGPTINERRDGDLSIFSYNIHAEIRGEWTEAERACRGLILNNKNGEVVALPFEKFFNHGVDLPTSDVDYIQEKLDGSLGILYRKGREKRVATRGSFNSEQALFATEFLRNFDLEDLPENLTLLFEILYPENRIVLDYAGRHDVVLLGARDRFSYRTLDLQEVNDLGMKYGFSMPALYSHSLSDLEKLQEEAKGIEGFVVTFKDGKKIKFKTKEYFELHRIATRRSVKWEDIVEAVEKEVEPLFLAKIPDEFRKEYEEKLEWIANEFLAVEMEVVAFLKNAQLLTRKEFALLANKTQIANILYSAVDGKDFRSLIYKKIKNENP